MGTTANRQYPYPSGSSAVQIPADIRALADAVDADLTDGFTWQDWGPLITAASTNPVFGIGAIRTGRFVKLGKLVRATAQIQYGPGAISPGSGIYSLTLPVASTVPAAGYDMIGQGLICCAGLFTPVQVIQQNNGLPRLLYTTAAYNSATLGIVSSSAPGTFNSNDWIRLSMTYEAA